MGQTPTQEGWAEYSPLTDPTEFMRSTADLLVRNCTSVLEESSTHRIVRLIRGTNIGNSARRYFLEIPGEGIHWEGFLDQNTPAREFKHPGLDQVDLYYVPIEIPMTGVTKTFKASLSFDPEEVDASREIKIETDGLEEVDHMPDFLLRSAIKDHVEKVTAYLKANPRIPAKPKHIPPPKRNLDIA